MTPSMLALVSGSPHRPRIHTSSSLNPFRIPLVACSLYTMPTRPSTCTFIDEISLVLSLTLSGTCTGSPYPTLATRIRVTPAQVDREFRNAEKEGELRYFLHNFENTIAIASRRLQENIDLVKNYGENLI